MAEVPSAKVSTVSLRAEVTLLKFASPLYWTEMEWPPVGRVDVVRLAMPPVKGTVPRTVDAPDAVLMSVKVAVPVGVLGIGLRTVEPVVGGAVRVAVKVTALWTRMGLADAVRASTGVAMETVSETAAALDAEKVPSPA